MRTIGVVSGSRADYGIVRPILKRIKESSQLRPLLMVTGSHLSRTTGLTVTEIENDGFEIDERIESLPSSDEPQAISQSIGIGTIGFSQAFARCQPDILLVTADRFEMFAAAIAALPFNIPIAHVHGGELTFGAFDDAIRHAMTKMSHLHFVALEEYRLRLMQMGEEARRIHLSGAPSLDNLENMALLNCQQLEELTGISFAEPVLLVTFHPVTLEVASIGEQIEALISALEEVNMPALISSPNADTGNHKILAALQDYVARHDNARFVQNLGSQAYYSCMKYAAAMVGNSSSGIIEAASFELPVVNIGTRQQGRAHGTNVLPVGNSQREIVQAIKSATDPLFRKSLVGLANLYHAGNASKIIVDSLSTVSIDRDLLFKKFNDVPILREAKEK